MATQKKTPGEKAPASTRIAKSATRKSAATKKAGTKATKKTAGKKSAKKTSAKPSGKNVSGKTASKKISPPQAKAKKESLIKQKRSTGDGPACWPGFERVAGKEAGTKGSCKPKPNQTGGERKEDAREAAGSKLRKAGGNKAKANKTK